MEIIFFNACDYFKSLKKKKKKRQRTILVRTGDERVNTMNYKQLTMHISKQERLSQCWFNAGPASQTVGQH